MEFVSEGGVTMFAESDAFRVTEHRHPAWKIVLPLGGRVAVNGTVADGGAVVPPQLTHACDVTSGYIALFLDPWELAPGASFLGHAAAGRVMAALGPSHDLAAARAELVRVRGGGEPPEPRVARAVRALTDADQIGTLAAGLSISAPRLRSLVRTQVGIPLARLRQWTRLRAALAELPANGTAAATAAAAGFADQAHFTRTARALLGRTPSEVLTHQR